MNLISRSLLVFLAGIISFCQPVEKVDLIIFNGKIYSVDENNPNPEAIGIHDGKIVFVGKLAELRSKYSAKEELDLQGKALYPGFMDAHSHFLGYSQSLLRVDLRACNSIEECIDRIKTYRNKYPDLPWILGRGWDQTLWGGQMPDKSGLDEAFPDVPVFLGRVDGHAAWANSKAMELAGIDPEQEVEGGEIMLMDGELQGVLIDNAMNLVYDIIPENTDEVLKQAMDEGQKNCFEVGLTNVADCGLEKKNLLLMKELSDAGSLKIRVYAMSNPGAEEFEFLRSNGPVVNPGFTLRSVKVYADGALGSRGACLKEDYYDRQGWKGLLLTDLDSISRLAGMIRDLGLQMNTHAIGDSANFNILNIYEEALQDEPDPRWRIEHAQVVSPEDQKRFSLKILPSVQPTHATSDMRWAEDRLGPDRVGHGYAYKNLLSYAGVLPLGSDFPVEDINPLYGFYAAVARQDHQGQPESGWQMENSLTREEALKGMTTWAAFSQFEENEKGMIKEGYLADIVILEKDIMTIPLKEVLEPIVYATMVNGEFVYRK